MLKALFLDMDETLCDTHGANVRAKELMAEAVSEKFGNAINADQFTDNYVDGIYRFWKNDQESRYMPLIESEGEQAFRTQLIYDLLVEAGAELSSTSAEKDYVISLQENFDNDRIANFHFYPGIKEFLIEAREIFTLVVITNGPEFSQLPKIEAVQLRNYVDHVIVGGQEPEQKPARSIFAKALNLAECEAHEAIHVGDSLAADIAGANGSGITSLWIQHQQPLDAELGIDPSHTIVHPTEIPDAIRRIHS